jgi:hypothetical protein
LLEASQESLCGRLKIGATTTHFRVGGEPRRAGPGAAFCLRATHFDKMNMDESGIQIVAASDTSCCNVSRAPIPQFQSKATDLFLAARIEVLDPTGDTPRIQQLPPALIVQDVSPPPLQSLLCTFLI